MYRKDKKTQKDNKNKRDKKDKYHMYDRTEIRKISRIEERYINMSRIEERYSRIKWEKLVINKILIRFVLTSCLGFPKLLSCFY